MINYKLGVGLSLFLILYAGVADTKEAEVSL